MFSRKNYISISIGEISKPREKGVLSKHGLKRWYPDTYKSNKL
jgi:hypothetical protein